MHEGEAKLHLHCQSCSVLCTVTFIAKHFSPGASSGDINRTPGSGLSVKRGYTLSICCVYLISLLFPALPFQICYAFRSPFLSPLIFYCFTVFPHKFMLHLSLLYWRFTFRRGRFSCHHPVQSSCNIGVCLMRGPFIASLTFPSLPPFPIFPPAGFLLHIFQLCFHLPLDCLTCCVPGSLWTVLSHQTSICHSNSLKWQRPSHIRHISESNQNVPFLLHCPTQSRAESDFYGTI